MILPNRALIVRQQWGEPILRGEKTWEMRGRKTAMRGRVAIIFSGTGLIFGEVNIIDSLGCVTGPERRHETIKFHGISCASTINRWPFPWVLSNAIRYETPIKYNHPRGAVIWVDLTKDGVINND